jgi:hypothetical protein
MYQNAHLTEAKRNLALTQLMAACMSKRPSNATWSQTYGGEKEGLSGSCKVFYKNCSFLFSFASEQEQNGIFVWRGGKEGGEKCLKSLPIRVRVYG